MFDETTTNQKQKQTDLFLSFWDGQLSCVATKCLGSLCFATATVTDINKMFVNAINDSEYKFPWNNLFNTSADGPNISKAPCGELSSTLKGIGYKDVT